ncbi:MAG: hypothetical protein M1827_006051 [Pycnora praestabilis]|nr:MAG: hypothetical protein M1827_006051 [Pycnora praestabilis]
MLLRTDTTSKKSFTRTGLVTYAIEDSSPTITVTVPAGSYWTSGLHWHENHTEFLQIVRGRALVNLNGNCRVYTPRDDTVRVERFSKHEWKRAPKESESAEEGDLIVKEWTDPADGQKEIFFRNLSSIFGEDYSDSYFPVGWWITLQLFVIFYSLDNFPVIVDGFAGGLITHMLLGFATLVGKSLGLKSIYPEYTPKRLLKRELEEDKND